MTELVQAAVVGEVIDPVTSPEIKTPIPTVRSHHLRFAGWGMNLGELAAESPEAFVETWTKRVITWLNSIDPFARFYAKTTVRVRGKDTSEQYKNNLASGLRQLIDADDDQDFTIVEETPDSIVCEPMELCEMSEHCGQRYGFILQGDQIVLGESNEREDTDRFLEAAAVLGIPVNIEPTMSGFADSEQIEVRKFTLKAGVIRQIIRFMAESDEFKDFFDDQFKDWDKMRSPRTRKPAN